MRFFEDIKVGERQEIGRHVFTADEIKAFAGRFDPQRFHVDDEEAKRSHFGALCASGWHTASVWMRLLIDVRREEDQRARAQGLPIPRRGPAVGMRDLKWLKPVYANDTISYAVEIIAKRVSNSRPTRGLVTLRGTGTNQHGELVISFDSIAFVERRAEAT
jgi:acyl dehydratase